MTTDTTAVPGPGDTRFPLWTRAVAAAILLYMFLLSITMMGASFKLFGKEFATGLVEATSNPVAGLFIGILATSLVQSSSTTSSLIVGVVATGMIPVETAIPMIMGANVGTTITNTIVSFGFVTRKEDFRRAFAGATVHDAFNVLTLIVLFPIEVVFHPIQRLAEFFTGTLGGVEGAHLPNPLKLILKPVSGFIEHVLTDTMNFTPRGAAWLILSISLIVMIFSLVYLVRNLKVLVVKRAEEAINRYLFRNDFTAFLLGLVLTVSVQSSSITTSLIVPMVGAGVVSLRRCYPFTLGANVGTTCTALLASMAGDQMAGLTVALAHLIFNVMGIAIFYPLRSVPIFLAQRLADLAVKSKVAAIMFVLGLFFVLPLVFVVIFKFFS